MPYPSSKQTPAQILSGPQVWSFVSEPTLHPIKVTINTFNPATDPGYVFLDPYSSSADATYGQAGALIFDNSGNPVWFRPTGNLNLMNTDFRVQHFNGKPVLTFWQGTLATAPGYTNLPDRLLGARLVLLHPRQHLPGDQDGHRPIWVHPRHSRIPADALEFGIVSFDAQPCP